MIDNTIECSRCNQKRARLTAPPQAGELGQRIRDHVCEECWQLWREMEVRTINELRLNFMDPEAQRTLVRHLCSFLKLPEE